MKTFITPTFNSNIPPLESNGHVFTDEYEKANIFYNYFKNQTILDDTNAVLPEIPPPSYNTQLRGIVLTSLEVESVIKTLKTGKASGPNGLNIRILKELSKELSSPFCSLFNQSLHIGVFPSTYNNANVCPVPKKATYLLSQTIDQYLYLTLRVSCESDSCSNTCSVTSRTIICYPLSNLDSFPAIRQSTNLRYCTIHFVRHWTLAKKFEPSSVTSAKHLIVSCTQVSYTKLKLLVSQEKFLSGLGIIFLTGDNG